MPKVTVALAATISAGKIRSGLIIFVVVNTSYEQTTTITNDFLVKKTKSKRICLAWEIHIAKYNAITSFKPINKHFSRKIFLQTTVNSGYNEQYWTLKMRSLRPKFIVKDDIINEEKMGDMKLFVLSKISE